MPSDARRWAFPVVAALLGGVAGKATKALATAGHAAPSPCYLGREERQYAELIGTQFGLIVLSNRI
jgi:hypothetical protein